jgi:hypothetical protein
VVSRIAIASFAALLLGATAALELERRFWAFLRSASA